MTFDKLIALFKAQQSTTDVEIRRYPGYFNEGEKMARFCKNIFVNLSRLDKLAYILANL